MSIRYVWTLTGAAVLSCAVAFAQSNEQAPAQSTGQAGVADETPITLVGCIQREAEYRRTHDLGRGGVAATGLGRGNEYVLINASRAGSAGAAAPADLDCSFEATPQAYELTGDRERELEPFVGRVVQINGMLKEADTKPVGTSGVEPTGGVDPLGQDLRLFEVNVTAYQEPAATAPAPLPAEPAPAAPEAPPIGTAGTEEQLPRTAGPLPIAGLLGLLSLGGAFGVRALRRR